MEHTCVLGIRVGEGVSAAHGWKHAQAFSAGLMNRNSRRGIVKKEGRTLNSRMRAAPQDKGHTQKTGGSERAAHLDPGAGLVAGILQEEKCRDISQRKKGAHLDAGAGLVDSVVEDFPGEGDG